MNNRLTQVVAISFLYLGCGATLNILVCLMVGVCTPYDAAFSSDVRAVRARDARISWLDHRTVCREFVIVDLRSIHARRPADHTPTPFEVGSRVSTRHEQGDALPEWVTDLGLAEYRDACVGTYGMLRYDSAGFPLPCTVRVVGWRMYRGPPELVDGLTIVQERGALRGSIPIRARARAFAVNTLFYTLCVIGGAHALRAGRCGLRRRRGLCPRCGYSATSPRCPECHAVQRASRLSATERTPA